MSASDLHRQMQWTSKEAGMIINSSRSIGPDGMTVLLRSSNKTATHILTLSKVR